MKIFCSFKILNEKYNKNFKMNSLEKNLLDLKHSLSSTKASLFFSIGVGGFLAILFGLLQLKASTLMSILISIIWLDIFVWISIKYFIECGNIQNIINGKIKK